MKILKFQHNISYYQFFVLLLFFFFYSASAAAFTENLTWPSLDNQKCNKYGTVSYLQQAVGILDINESIRITIPVPKNTDKAYFAAKSHAPKPSMAFSKTNYRSICYNADASQCPADQIPVALNGRSDTLAAVNKSYVDKNLAINSEDKYVYVYQTNTGENFGTSSMYAASISFRLTAEECANRAAGVVGSDEPIADAGSITNKDGSITIDTISYTTDPDVLLKENLRDKNSTLNESFTSNKGQFKMLKRTNNSNQLILLDDGSMSFFGVKSEAFDYELIDTNNTMIATGTVEITVNGDETFDPVSDDVDEVTVVISKQNSDGIKPGHNPVFYREDGTLHINSLLIKIDDEVLEAWVDLQYIPNSNTLEVIGSGLVDSSILNEKGSIDQDDDGFGIDEDCNDNDPDVYPDYPEDEHPENKTFNCSLE
jgi:hypothetical protein